MLLVRAPHPQSNLRSHLYFPSYNALDDHSKGSQKIHYCTSNRPFSVVTAMLTLPMKVYQALTLLGFRLNIFIHFILNSIHSCKLNGKIITENDIVTTPRAKIHNYTRVQHSSCTFLIVNTSSETLKFCLLQYGLNNSTYSNCFFLLVTKKRYHTDLPARGYSPVTF